MTTPNLLVAVNEKQDALSTYSNPYFHGMILVVSTVQYTGSSGVSALYACCLWNIYFKQDTFLDQILISFAAFNDVNRFFQ